MRKVSGCIVSYNGADEVIRAVQSLAKHTKRCQFTLYIIDNASPDGTGKALQQAQFAGDVQVVLLPQNVGFGKGHNTVLPWLFSDYHFVINPDVLVDSDVISDICDWMDAHPDVVMATPRLLFPDTHAEQILPKRKPNLLGLLARQGVPGLQKYGDRYAMLDADLSKPTPIEFCTGSFFCMRTQTFCAIGGFDEGYFMYVEDADITQKARQLGQVMYLPQLTAYHAWHRAPNRQLKPFMMQAKSMLRYFSKWGFRFK